MRSTSKLLREVKNNPYLISSFEIMNRFFSVTEEEFQQMKVDREVILAAISGALHTFEFADDSLKNDPCFLEQAIQVNPMVLGLAPQQMRNDRKLVHFAALQPGVVPLFLDRVVGDELKKDQPFMDEEGYGIALRSMQNKFLYPNSMDRGLIDKPMVLEKAIDLFNLITALKASEEVPVAQLTKILTDTEYFLCTGDVSFYSRTTEELQASSSPFLNLLGISMLALSVVCLATGVGMAPAAGTVVLGGCLYAHGFFRHDSPSQPDDKFAVRDEMINLVRATTPEGAPVVGPGMNS